MTVNIPLYKAKRLNSNKYITGQFLWDNFEDKYWIKTLDDATYSVDPTTLSIHFPDMIDSEGAKIFASLQKDGKGGDICEAKWFENDIGLTVKTEAVKYSNKGILQDSYNISRYEYIKVIGIQE